MRSGVDHTVLPANHTTPAFTSSSPGGAATEWTVIAPADEAYYSFIDPVRMKGWVGLVKNWPLSGAGLSHSATQYTSLLYSNTLQKVIIMWLLFLSAYDEVQTALLLVLGCAVQCERREDFIENIQRLAVDVQEAIVYHIKQVNSLSHTRRRLCYGFGLFVCPLVGLTIRS